MLKTYGELSPCAYETIRELMNAAAFEQEGFHPGKGSTFTVVLPMNLNVIVGVS